MSIQLNTSTSDTIVLGREPIDRRGYFKDLLEDTRQDKDEFQSRVYDPHNQELMRGGATEDDVDISALRLVEIV